MRKTFKSFLIALVLILGLALTACEMGGTGSTECTHQPGASWRTNKEQHWKVCDLCQEQVQLEDHTYGEWIVVSAPAVAIDGKEYRQCSVCRYYEERAIPGIVVETGVAEADTAVYAQVPAEWTNVNCYFFAEDKTALDLTVGWPGDAMTLVDEATNTWGYIVPAGTGYVIFNNGSTQTADLIFATSLNYYKLSTLDGDGKYLADYDIYTPAADQPELNKYPYKEPVEESFRTIYVQYPAEWSVCNFYFWGTGIASPAWPGMELTLVDADAHIYSYELSSKITGIIFNDGTTQTADIIPNPQVNGYVVSADGSYVEKTYSNGAFEEMKATYYVQLPTSWSVHNAYYWGDNHNPVSWPGVEMEAVDAENGIYSISLTSEVSKIIFNNGTTQTADIPLKAAVNGYVVSADGAHVECTYENGVFTEYVEENPQPVELVLYLRGGMNGWGTTDQLVCVDGVYSITMEITAGTEFKVADSGWSNEVHYNMLKDVDATLFGPNSDAKPNITCLVSGTYVITVYNAGTAEAYGTITPAQ